MIEGIRFPFTIILTSTTGAGGHEAEYGERPGATITGTDPFAMLALESVYVAGASKSGAGEREIQHCGLCTIEQLLLETAACATLFDCISPPNTNGVANPLPSPSALPFSS